SYVPAPAPKPAAPPASKEQEDQGAAAPGEAIADGTGEPKADSTPDDPAEVIDIDDSRNT
ncbi:MAG: hypothetical protein L0H93_13160, partial [Nocardioides sp.]|nr:hypothetical protein [Nocardioides sp.]